MTLSEALAFVAECVCDPWRVSAVAPSSDSLADLITGEITASHAPIIELGPGTGVFTRWLLQRGVPEEQLALVESGTEFAKKLDGEFPEATILCMDASLLAQAELFDGQMAGAIVSGLPLVSMSTRKVVGVLRSAFAHLRPGGSLYQFTYYPRCPVRRTVLARCGLQAKRIGGTFFNLPPAAVYKISRLDQPVLHANSARIAPSPRTELQTAPFRVRFP